MEKYLLNVADLIQSVKEKIYDEPLEHTRIVKLEDLTNEDLYSKTKDSKGVPLLNKIEKYPDLSEDAFIPAEYYLPDGCNVSRIYLVNKLGQIKNSITGIIMKSYSDKDGYSITSLKINDPNNKRKNARIKVHRLIASTFLINPNYTLYKVVNHEDHKKDNNELNNLSWITVTKNGDKSDGTNSGIKEEDKMNYIGYDDEGNEVVRITDKDSIRGEIIYQPSQVRRSISKSVKYKGLLWKRSKPIKKQEDLKRIGFSGNLDDYIWYQHPLYPELYVCKEGFVKSKNKGILCYVDSSGYINMRVNKKIKMRANRVIMEFLEERKLEEGELVDHINSNTLDNSFENLRITNIIENNNNRTTKSKQSRILVITDLLGNYVKDGFYSDFDNLLESNTSKVLLSKTIKSKYICIKPGDKNSLYNKMEYVTYVFKDNKIVDCFVNYPKDISKYTNKSLKSLKNKIKNKEITDKGFLLLKGPEAVKKVIELGNGNAVNFEPNPENYKEKPKVIDYSRYEKYLEIN